MSCTHVLGPLGEQMTYRIKQELSQNLYLGYATGKLEVQDHVAVLVAHHITQRRRKDGNNNKSVIDTN